MTSKEAIEKLGVQCMVSNDIDGKCFEELRIIEEDLDQLEEYRKIEKEIGINLIILFKALKGIWVKSTNGDAYYVGSPYLCFSEDEKRELEFQFRVGGTWYKIKDRGKTWALDKEEFYKNIK